MAAVPVVHRGVPRRASPSISRSGRRTLTGRPRRRFATRCTSPPSGVSPAGSVIAVCSPDLRGVGDVARPPVPPFDGRGATADQVGGVRLAVALVGIHPRPSSRPRKHIVSALIGGRSRSSLLSRFDRDRGPAVPPLRPRRRRPQDPHLRRLRALRDGHLPRGGGRRRRVAGTRQLVPHHGGGRGRGAHVPTGARAAHAVRQPLGLRKARDAVRGAVRVLRTGRRRLRRSWTCCRGWRGSWARASGPSAPTCGWRLTEELRDVAVWPDEVPGRSRDPAPERVDAPDRGDGPGVPGRAGGRAAGRARGPQAIERSRLAVGREADRRSRCPKPDSC